MKTIGWFRLFVLSLALVAVFGCGRTSDLANNTDAISQFRTAATSQLGNSPLANPAIHDEIRSITSEIENGILAAIVPGYQSTSSAKLAGVGCSPKFGMAGIGVSITFASSSTCALNGTVSLSLIPLAANVNLSVVGFQFISGIQINGNIQMSKGSPTTVSLQFINGNLALNPIPLLPPIDISMNGLVSLTTATGVFQIDSRLNAFDSSSGLGVALLSREDTAAGINQFQACLLSAGVASDPTAGNATTCFNIGGG